MRQVIRVAEVLVVALATAQTAVAQQNRIASFEMAWPTERREQIVERVHAAAEIMTGQQLRRPVIREPAPSARATTRRVLLTLRDAPALEAQYLPEYAELRIVNTELAASTNPSREMSQEEAVNVARRMFDELARRKVLEPRHYDWKNADIASTWVGGGSLDGKTSEKKRVEYRITLRRAINGIELANAGLRIAVHVSGRVSGLRLGGVTVASKLTDDVEEPIAAGRWLTRQVSIEALQARFQREIAPQQAKPQVAWSHVMYVMPENRRRAVVEPLYVISYSLEFSMEGGETAVSRRRTVGLSLVNQNAPPIDLTPPVRAPQADTLRKPAPKEPEV